MEDDNRTHDPTQASTSGPRKICECVEARVILNPACAINRISRLDGQTSTLSGSYSLEPVRCYVPHSNEDLNLLGSRTPDQLRGHQRRRRILDAAWNLIDRCGPHSTEVSARRIALDASSSVGVLYYYFDDLDQIYATVAELYAQRLRAYVQSGTVSTGNWISIVDSMDACYVDYFQCHPGLREFWFDDQSSAQVRLIHQHYRDLIATDLHQTILAATGRNLPNKVCTISITISGALYELAFRLDKRGDQEVLSEARYTMREYIAKHVS